jgi:Fic family protein
MSDSESSTEIPTIDDPFERDEDAERRVYSTVLGSRKPAAVQTIADQATCDPKTARKYLDWFARLGIVRKHEGRPTTYERNEAFFESRLGNSSLRSLTGQRAVGNDIE